MGDLLDDVALSPDRVARPERQWRNRWLSKVYTAQGDAPGDLYWGKRIWPSKDAAETAASEQLAEFGEGEAEYKDAHPVGGSDE